MSREGAEGGALARLARCNQGIRKRKKGWKFLLQSRHQRKNLKKSKRKSLKVTITTLRAILLPWILKKASKKSLLPYRDGRAMQKERCCGSVIQAPDPPILARQLRVFLIQTQRGWLPGGLQYVFFWRTHFRGFQREPNGERRKWMECRRGVGFRGKEHWRGRGMKASKEGWKVSTNEKRMILSEGQGDESDRLWRCTGRRDINANRGIDKTCGEEEDEGSEGGIVQRLQGDGLQC